MGDFCIIKLVNLQIVDKRNLQNRESFLESVYNIARRDCSR